MKALLLAAGFGSRLQPLTKTIPKCLVSIRGTPLLQYWLDLLLAGSVDEVLINTHYLHNEVKQFVEKSKWKSQIKLVHEAALLGTGGTILKNKDFFGDKSFLVAHADNLTRFSLDKFCAKHSARPKNSVITMMTFNTDSPEKSGIVSLNSEGVVINFHEKIIDPPGSIANAAVYIFEPQVIDFLRELRKPVIDLSTEVIPNFLGKISTFHNSDYHRDIGDLKSLQQANEEF